MLSDCETMSYQDEISVAEEEYQIVSRKGKILFATFDSKTSVDCTKAILEDKYGEPPRGHKYELVFGVERPRKLLEGKEKLRDIFATCLSFTERRITWYFVPHERMKKRKTIDWNPKLTKMMDDLCQCGGCGIVPLQRHHWIRCVKPDVTQGTRKSKRQGCWRCAAMYKSRNACLAQWGSGGGTHRVLVINYDYHFKAGNKYDILMLGEIIPRYEFILMLLRSAKLLGSSSNDITENQLIAALNALVC